MSMSFLTYPYNPSWDFVMMVDAHMALTQKLVNMTFNYRNVRVEKLSFVDYDNKCFFSNFPFGKQLCIHNTSTVDKFGYGRYVGNFFDVIVRLEDGNPMNLRIFYGIEGESTEVSVEKEKEGETMFILGKDRKCFKKGRATYIEYESKFISLTDAKKLEKSFLISNK